MQPLETKMVKAQMVSGVEGWSTSWAVKSSGRTSHVEKTYVR